MTTPLPLMSVGLRRWRSNADIRCPGSTTTSASKAARWAGVGRGGQHPVGAGGGAVTDSGDEALQRGPTVQEDLGFHEPVGGQVEQHAEPLVNVPGPPIQSPRQLEPLDGSERGIAVEITDLGLVVPVSLQIRRVEAELVGDVPDDHRRGQLRVSQERAQETEDLVLADLRCSVVAVGDLLSQVSTVCQLSR